MTAARDSRVWFGALALGLLVALALAAPRVTTIGCRTPTSAIEATNSAKASSSNLARG